VSKNFGTPIDKLPVFVAQYANIRDKGSEEEEYCPPIRRESCSPAERQLVYRRWEGSFGTGRVNVG